MSDWPLLTITTFLPLLGALLILTIRGDAEVVARNSRNVAMLTSLATLVVSLAIWNEFDAKSADFQLID